MKQVERVGISVQKDLLSEFDDMITAQGYQSRSEAVRDLIRSRLSKKKLEHPHAHGVAAVCMVYDHHSSKLMDRLTDLQHSHLLETICSMHVHLDQRDCMEIVVLKGKVGRINALAEKIVSLKGVKLGKVNLVAVDEKHNHTH